MTLENRYKPRIALFDTDKKWLCSAARAVNLNRSYELDWVIDLSFIMDRFIDTTRCLGISSNNIFWNKTDVPLRIMYVPHPVYEKYVTLVNPEIKEMSRRTFESVEGCAAFPNKGFRVRRSCYVRLSGFAMRNYELKPVELEYGTDEKILSPKNRNLFETAWIVQHELDHLEGILLKDKAVSSFEVDE